MVIQLGQDSSEDSDEDKPLAAEKPAPSNFLNRLDMFLKQARRNVCIFCLYCLDLLNNKILLCEMYIVHIGNWWVSIIHQ